MSQDDDDESDKGSTGLNGERESTSSPLPSPSLMGLFAPLHSPLSPGTPSFDDNDGDDGKRNHNRDHSNGSSYNDWEQTPLVKNGGRNSITSSSCFASTETKRNGFHHHGADSTSNMPSLPSIYEIPVGETRQTTSSSPPSPPLLLWHQRLWSKSKEACGLILTEGTKSTTWIGSFMFLLYHIVFCLTFGSTITRKHSPTHRSLVGLMTKTTAMGIFFSAPIFWFSLADDIPALYPTTDLFTAPFFASIASIVDECLYQDQVHDDEDDMVFLATFSFLVSLSLALSGVLLSLASVFKLADLASFLPTSVISGFFAAVGVLLWTLAVKVDTHGLTVEHIVTSGDWLMVQYALLHHLPSVATASIMKIFGTKHPFGCAGVVIAVIVAFHGTMFFLGLSMEEMVERKWFWSMEDLVYAGHGTSNSTGTDLAAAASTFWTPPHPLGWIHTLCSGRVHWACVTQALPTVMAFAPLYLIRCSVHAAALKKNVPMMQRKVQHVVPPPPAVGSISTLSFRALATSPQLSRPPPLTAQCRKFSEQVDIEHTAVARTQQALPTTGEQIEHPPNSKHTMKEMLFPYGLVQYIVALVGSFAVLPSVAASSTLYSLNADGVSPQLGSVVLLALFYLTDFRLVRFIPKAAFSAMLILAFINMIQAWLVDSYFKTKDKLEWLVVPLIVVLAFAVDLLSAVFLGISCSTFFFAAAFFRSGVVKYLATGATIRSTIERPFVAARWLDQNGDLIQVLFLQNYLFFGNASSILTYICSMFEEAIGDPGVGLLLPPFPKVVILDLQLVSGIDGSAVDVFADILSVCKSKNCKLFLSGVSVSVRKTMALRGVKPEVTQDRSARFLRFFYDFDAAVGKAEDLLLEEHSFEEFFGRAKRPRDSGFVHALRVIDEQHGTSFGNELAGLEEFTVVVDLEPGEVLYDQQNLDRGLFFIEEGTMKIDRAAEGTYTRSVSTNSLSLFATDNWSFGTIGRQLAGMQTRSKGDNTTQTFRVARIGPGWVLGMTEAASGLVNPGSSVAVDACRLHYISFKSLEEIEKQHPKLSLKLYKLLSLLMAKQQETTVSHLAMIHAIFGSLAPNNKPISRNDVPSRRRRNTLNGQQR